MYLGVIGMSDQFQACSIEFAFSDDGEGILDEWIPREAQVLDGPGYEYQPNKFCHWIIRDEKGIRLREGVVYTKYCSRKRRRTWLKHPEFQHLELIYLVESSRGIRYSNLRIRYVVSPIYQENQQERIRVELGNKISYWPRSRAKIAIKQGGHLLIKGSRCETLEEYDAYVKFYRSKGQTF